MAIAATAGGSGSTTVAATSKALSAFSVTTGRKVVVAVALDDTTKSVTSITDTAGNTYVSVGAINGTGVRTEIWRSTTTASNGTNVVTINVSGACNIAGAAEEYSGATNYGNTGTSTGNSRTLGVTALTQDGGSYVTGALGFACVSGDTLTALLGTSRQSSIPAATAVGVALYDNTVSFIATVETLTRISTARQWAAHSLELRSGTTPDVPTFPEGRGDYFLNVEVSFGGPQFPELGQTIPTSDAGIIIV